jgi:amidophosphoribosyltransferase
LKAAVQKCNPKIKKFDCSCFDGEYITGDITADYLDIVEAARTGGKANKELEEDQLELDLAMSLSSM